MRLPLASLEKRDEERRRHDERVYEWARTALADGATLTPDTVPTPKK
ncbi:MAG: hypothetical protein GWN79_04845 [Actinobacteria bacterium]|nr:hypothetical protein [Actinomycetota bacterium]NIU18453.1 hypothetical protein [Actinomycetota bacterium]NIV56915.1 hypothetical protein [Actinomycetota bacterium]NIX19604.1 hypothetical protein [Actinomycetota bacterium]NIX51724.1 hypothetical protein [Actinomycetota bacterium]